MLKLLRGENYEIKQRKTRIYITDCILYRGNTSDRFGKKKSKTPFSDD